MGSGLMIGRAHRREAAPNGLQAQLDFLFYLKRLMFGHLPLIDESEKSLVCNPAKVLFGHEYDSDPPQDHLAAQPAADATRAHARGATIANFSSAPCAPFAPIGQ